MNQKTFIPLLILITMTVSGCAALSGGKEQPQSAAATRATTDSAMAGQTEATTDSATKRAGSEDASSTDSQRGTILLGTVYFDFDSHLLSEEARKTLQENARTLAANQQIRITIAGHCDERGSDSYNLALGDRRANAVKSYLIDLGLKTDQLETVSFGEERPADPGHDEAAWAKNRRGEFLLL